MEDVIKNLINNGLVDAHLSAMGWTDSGEDIWIQFNLSDDTTVKLLFIWATGLLVDMNFGEYFGMPLILSTNFTHVDNKSWEINIILGAAPEGEIKFNCNYIQLIKGKDDIAH